MPDSPEPSESDGFVEELLAVSGRRRRVLLQQKVRSLAARVLDLDHPDQIELGQPLHDMGLDSLMAVELRNLLGGAVGAELPATLLFEHPSVTELVDHLTAAYLSDLPPVDGGVPAAGTGEPERTVVTTRDVVERDERDSDELAAALAARLDRLSPRAP